MDQQLAIEVSNVRADLGRMTGEFSAVLPPQIPAERFIRTIVTAVQMDPSLLMADRRSLYGSCMKAAQDGLQLDGREAALVIFKDRKNGGSKVQYMPMVGGILKKIRNSGEISTISAHVVYSNDQFEYELGDSERITHKPKLEDRGQPVAVYAIARGRDGGVYREVMSVAEVRKVQSVSRSRDSGPWSSWWDEMARKTVVRRLAKYLPTTIDLDQTLNNDNADYVLPATVSEPAAGAIRGGVVADLNRQIAASRTAAVSEPEIVEELPIQEAEPAQDSATDMEVVDAPVDPF